SSITSSPSQTTTSPTLCSSAEWYPNAATVAGSGGGKGQLSNPVDIAIDSPQNLIVADYGSHRLQKYFLNNSTIITLETNVTVQSICVDKFDNIYFTNLNCQCV
ncbi:unnamed protein product, partial [Didymodactylos carnosus]